MLAAAEKGREKTHTASDCGQPPGSGQWWETNARQPLHTFWNNPSLPLPSTNSYGVYSGGSCNLSPMMEATAGSPLRWSASPQHPAAGTASGKNCRNSPWSFAYNPRWGNISVPITVSLRESQKGKVCTQQAGANQYVRRRILAMSVDPTPLQVWLSSQSTSRQTVCEGVLKTLVLETQGNFCSTLLHRSSLCEMQNCFKSKSLTWVNNEHRRPWSNPSKKKKKTCLPKELFLIA